MTRLLDQAVETVSVLPDEVQDELTRILLLFAGVEQAPVKLTPDESTDLAEADAEISRGELATAAEVAALWAKHGR